eukprot:CAMPEP_0185023854 /NCGR_PEP_ID=MMETSP1103-20130426/6472_1 /TAXON_ID=36769 /ORGANISM="Paraphysomonas bandaiensis, Strain Caron Lab Isolate" /LENGTH=654 /DNA_ID=CAMNT_0027556625 /DNA_START=581 /DNA_END=2545 /DNA_ORIENTATION=+
MRQQYMRDGDPDVAQQQLYSCIVENIPLELRGSNKLQQLFEQLFPGEVYCARIGMNYTPIIKAAMERKAAITALENATAAYEASDRTKPPMVKLKGGKVAMCGGTEEVEAIKFYEKEVTRLNERIIELKQQAREMENGRTPTPSVVDGEAAEEEEENFTPKSLAGTGFVTFRSKRAQAAAYQLTVLHDQYPSLKAFQVQAPQNIIWDNLAVKIDQIKVVSMGTRAMYYGGLLFWAAILVVISGLAQMSNLEKYFPFLKQLDPVSYAILEGQLPVIALIVFIALLPMIFTSVSTYIERRKTKSDVQKEVFTWFFCYQLANVYLMLLAGSVLGALTSIIDNPLSIVNLLAAALPGVATFFINYFLTLLMSGVPMLLLNIGPVVIYKLYLSCFNPRKLTRRTLIEGPLANVDINYALVVPPVIYCLCISLLYMVIAPILLFIAGLLFSAWFVAWKYRLCYIIVPGVQSGGVFWYKMFNFSMTGLMFATLTMIGYMGIKQGAAQTVLLIPLPIIVNIVWSIAQDKFQQFSSDMAHHQAVLKDTKTGSGSSLDAETEFHDDFFVPPQLSGPVTACPEPYRIDNIPLVDEHGHLNPAYHTSANTTVNAVYRKKMSDYKPSNSTKSENDELKPMQVTQSASSVSNTGGPYNPIVTENGENV